MEKIEDVNSIVKGGIVGFHDVKKSSTIEEDELLMDVCFEVFDFPFT